MKKQIKKKVVAMKKKVTQTKNATVKKLVTPVKKVALKAEDKSKKVIKKIQKLSHQLDPMLKIVKANASKYGKIAWNEIIMLAEHLRDLIHEWTAKPAKKK